MQAKMTVFISRSPRRESDEAAPKAGRQKRRASLASPSGNRLTTAFALAGNDGTSHRKVRVAAAAPSSCATRKPGTSTGRIPANVSLAARASVTAGLANDVDD